MSRKLATNAGCVQIYVLQSIMTVQQFREVKTAPTIQSQIPIIILIHRMIPVMVISTTGLQPVTRIAATS